MSFGGMNPLAIVAAAVAAFLWGALYYTALSRPWVRAARLAPGSGRPLPVLLLTSLVAVLVMAWVLAGTIGHLGVGQVTLRNGIVTALFIWAGFIATTTAVNQRYQNFGWTLTLIDAGHWLGAMLLMGGVIGAFGV